MDPKDALSPRNRITAGSIAIIYTHPSTDWSVATMTYDGHAAVGMRWNGDINDRKDLGYPSARGTNGAWFVLPDEIAALVLALVLAAEATEASAGNLPPDRLVRLFDGRERRPKA
jgi:hypothetical protein